MTLLSGKLPSLNISNFVELIYRLNIYKILEFWHSVLHEGNFHSSSVRFLIPVTYSSIIYKSIFKPEINLTYLKLNKISGTIAVFGNPT